MPCAVADQAQVALALGCERRRMLLKQDPGEAIDRSDRRAQVVGNRVAERLQLLVRGLQLRRTVYDTLLKLGVERADLSFCHRGSAVESSVFHSLRAAPRKILGEHEVR